MELKKKGIGYSYTRVRKYSDTWFFKNFLSSLFFFFHPKKSRQKYFPPRETGIQLDNKTGTAGFSGLYREETDGEKGGLEPAKAIPKKTGYVSRWWRV